MGISLRAVRNAYHSQGTSIRKASGKVYTLKWYEPFVPLDASKYYHCYNALTVKEAPMNFTPLYMASKETGISINALRNACKKNNKKITRRKGEFTRYKISCLVSVINVILVLLRKAKM